MNKIGEIKERKILFLQGPMGTFFKKLDTLFIENGAITYKIGFNMGDSFFSNYFNYIPYRDKPENFSIFIKEFLIDKDINAIFLFGDCRLYQKIAIKVAKELNIEVFVFEEGYIRPNYITMEKYGVNNFSLINRDRKFYDRLPLEHLPKEEDVKYSAFKMSLYAMSYYLISNMFYFKYPHYTHHRDFTVTKELFFGVRNLYRKAIYPFYEKKYLDLIQNRLSKKYFFVPLQTHNDFQIIEHSKYVSIEEFIIEIIDSFANSNSNDYLIFKHHPIDRGRKNYKKFIEEYSKTKKVNKKIIILYDTHLPTLLKNAKGTITINSTVGLSSLYHSIPTITLGDAIYNIEGLTSKNLSLKEFWHKQEQPDKILFKKFRNFLIKNTQLNASFYGKFPSNILEKIKT